MKKNVNMFEKPTQGKKSQNTNKKSQNKAKQAKKSQNKQIYKIKYKNN